MNLAKKWMAAVGLAVAGASALHAAEARATGCAFRASELMVTVSDPPAGRADEYNHFLNQIHIPEVVDRMLGFAGAQRFRLVGSLGSAPWNFVSAYSLETDNKVATEGMKTKPGAARVEPPGPYLADGSAAWIVRRAEISGSQRVGECGRSEKLFVLLPPATQAQIDLDEVRARVPGLVIADRYEFGKATKGPQPQWNAMTILRSHSDLDVAATIRKLGTLVGCTDKNCADGAGAIWALVPLSGYVDRTVTDGDGRLRSQ